MKISFAEYARKVDVSVLVAQAVFNQLSNEYPLLTIADVAETTSGGTPSRSNSSYYDGDIPWMKSGELNDGLITEIEETITEEGLKNSSAKIYPKDTLVIALYGATAGKVGILGLDAASNQAVCAVFPNAKVDRDYLFWFLRQYRYNFIEISKGGAQPNISQGVINKTRLPVPPIDFQKSIAAFLKKTEVDGKLNFELIPEKYIPKVQQLFSIKNTYETLRSELTHQQTLLTRLRQSILQEAVQGQLTAQWRQPNPHQEPASELLRRIKAEKAATGKKEKPLPPVKAEEMAFELPEGWVWCRLGEIIDSFSGGFSYKSPLFKTQGNNQVLRLGNVKNDVLLLDAAPVFIDDKLANLTENYELKAGDILITMTGTRAKKDYCFTLLLNEGHFKNTQRIFLNQRVGCFRLPSTISKEFIIKILKLPFALEPVFKTATGTANQANIGKGALMNILIPLPPLPEQTAIVAQVERLLGLVGQLEAEAAVQRVQAEGLLQAALREAMGA